MSDKQPLSNAPAPKRTERTLTVAVMSLTALLTAWLAWSLRGEAAYALTSQTPVELGTLTAQDKYAGSFVRGRADLQGTPTAGYRRPFESDAYRVSQSKGSNIWVVYGVPAALDGPRFVPPALVAGRLVRADALGVRFGGIEAAIAELGGKGTANQPIWVLIDGEDPEGMTWVLGLEGLLLLFIAFNVLSIVRVMRRMGHDEVDNGSPLSENAPDAESPVR